MSSSLPSFVELMESLGLSPESKYPASSPESRSSHSRTTTSSHSRSRASRSASPASCCHGRVLSEAPRAESPTIIVSQQHDARPEIENAFKRRASSGNIKYARFSPYASSCSITRRGSMSALGDQRDGQKSKSSSGSRRSSSSSSSSGGSSQSQSSSGSSSSSSSSDSVPPVPPLPMRRARAVSPDRLKLAGPSCTPISSFARRRSPQPSPTSPSFAVAASRARSTNIALPSPVMIPTLPPMLAESLASFSFPASASASATGNHNDAALRRRRRGKPSPSASPCSISMDVDQDQENKPPARHHQAGLRISSLHRQIPPVA